MKNKDKIKIKAGVLLIVWLMIGISVSSVMGVTRTITDESDTVITYISNSEVQNIESWKKAAKHKSVSLYSLIL